MDSYIKVSDDKLFIDIEEDDTNLESVDIQDYIQGIDSRNLQIGVVGMGYSGLQIAQAFASAGFTVTGIEFDQEKAHQLNTGISTIEHVSSDSLKKVIKEDRFFIASDFDVLPELDVVIICDQMPTRLPKNNDLSFVMAVIENVISSLDKPKLVILDHPSEPGTCRQVIYPLFEDQHKKINKDYFLAVSPERVDPGNTSVRFPLVPRVVAGMTNESKTLAAKLFSTVVKTVVEVSCPTSAEMVKFFETSYRWVNTALINEAMISCNKYNISIWEIIKAVRSNPFEYFRFVPGPGYGATSQYNEEPFVLSVRKNITDMRHDLIDKAIEINTYVSKRYILDRISDLLNEKQKCLNGANILVIGIANKRNVNEWNESPAIDVIMQLLAKKANVYYHDPYIPKLTIDKRGFSLNSIALDDEMLSWVDLVVILMDHQNVDYKKIIDKASLILDTRNVTEKLRDKKNSVKLL